MKHKSKSKTFPKGTDPRQHLLWVQSQIGITDSTEYHSPTWKIQISDAKYLITITKIEDENSKTL